MPIYGGIASSIQINNDSPASAPCQVAVTGVTLPNQDGISWSISGPNGATLKYPINIPSGGSATIYYYVQYSESNAGENVEPVNFTYDVTGASNTVSGWLQLSTDPCGVIERPDYVHLAVSFDGQPSQIATQSQPDGNSDPDPFVLGISTTVSASGEDQTVSAVVSIADYVFEALLGELV
jgi:hypothetical protein